MLNKSFANEDAFDSRPTNRKYLINMRKETRSLRASPLHHKESTNRLTGGAT